MILWPHPHLPPPLNLKVIANIGAVLHRARVYTVVAANPSLSSNYNSIGVPEITNHTGDKRVCLTLIPILTNESGHSSLITETRAAKYSIQHATRYSPRINNVIP